MSALLTVMAVMASLNSIHHLSALHYALLLALQGITVGIFTALDTLLFFLFWELTLPPIFFLTGWWGIGPHRRSAAIKYTLFMLFGGTLLLLGFIILALYSGIHSATEASGLVFSLPELLKNPLPDKWQSAVFILLLIGFAVKTPLFPFHTWMPTMTMEGSAQLSALLTGLKLGAYGIIRFAMPLAPSAAVEYSWVLGVLGAITLIYGALIAIYQSNIRRLLAYASISHVGLVIVGVSALNLQGIQAVLFQLFNFTIVASSLMLIAGFLQHRLGSTEIIHLGGLAKMAPKMTGFYFLFAFASIGLPGTSGFPAEFLLILSALSAHPSLGVAALVAAILSAGYMLDFTRKAFWGPLNQKTAGTIQDLRPRELLILAVPAVLVLIFGFIPNIILDSNAKASEVWLAGILEQPLIKHDEVAGVQELD
jgi:NADH-quinone oxidoreductase subunit M